MAKNVESANDGTKSHFGGSSIKNSILNTLFRFLVGKPKKLFLNYEFLNITV